MMEGSRRLALVGALFSLAAAGSASAAVQVGQSGWTWSNPTPQGRTIQDLASVDGTRGYAAGDFGTLLTTGDAGATWSSIPTGLAQTFTRVYPFGGSFVAIGGCVARRSDDGGATLRRLTFVANEGTCASIVAAASFPTSTTGYLLQTDGTVLATEDGGATFSRRSTVPGAGPAGPATDLVMTSPTVGFAAAGGAIYRTPDGARSWSTVLTTANRITGITFADATTAYAAANASSASYKSTDGGLNWTPLPSVPNIGAGLERVRCANATTCIFTTLGGDKLVRTVNGGTTLTVVTPASAPIHSVAFFGANRVVAAGDQGVTVVSDDAGATWRQIGSRLDSVMTGLRANSDGFAYVWGLQGALATTNDGGATWRQTGVATSSAVNAVSFATPDIGYAVDTTGVVLRSANGGSSWQILDAGPDFRPVDVYAMSPTNVLLRDATGKLRRSADGGQSFASVGTPVVRALARRGERVGRVVFLYGPRAIAFSTNAGATWRTINGPALGRTRLVMRNAQCSSILVCWATTANGGVFRTINGGRTWLGRTNGASDVRIVGVAFRDRNRGYLSLGSAWDVEAAAGSGAWVLRTSDGGATWIPQLVSSAGAVRIATSGPVDYALDTFGSVFTTTTGGQRGTASVLTLRPSKRLIRSRTRVTLSGRLRPAQGGERVRVSAVGLPSQFVTVASNGRFSASFTIARTATFVAQWYGDASRAGDSSPAVTVTRRAARR